MALDDAEGNSTSVVSMLKSLDWAKAIAERRVTPMTSLACIVAVRRVGDGEREKLWRRMGKATKRAYKSSDVGRKRMYPTEQICGEQSWKALFGEGATPKFVDGQDGFCVDYKLAFVEW